MSKKISFLILFTLLFTSWGSIKAEEVKPDLVVSYLSVEDYSVDSYRVRYTIKNIGGGNVNGPVYCGYYINDNSVGYASVQCLLESESLGANEENQGIITFSKALSPDYESLTMVADSRYITSTQDEDSVEEENENNNTLEIGFGNVERPDLAFTGDINITIGYDNINYKLGVDNVDFNVGDLINITPAYVNQGGNYIVYDEANPFLSKLSIVKDKKSYYSKELSANSGGGAGLWDWEPTEAGVYTLVFYLDSSYRIDESDEDNNELEKTITIGSDDDDIEDSNVDNNGSDNDDSGIVKNDDDTRTDNSNTNQLVLQLQRQISTLEKQVNQLEKKLTQLDQKFADKYSGTMFLDVENHGRLWYVDPESKNRFYFENGEAALSIGSKLATGITYEDIQKIPVGIPDKLYNLTDSDDDGLPDRLESALGSNPNNSDSDGDGFSDKQELENEYNPVIDQKYNYDQSLIGRLEGKMLLQVSGPNSHGEIWYVKDGQRWYGGTEDSMYEIMKARSLGATPDNIRKITVGEVEGIE